MQPASNGPARRLVEVRPGALLLLLALLLQLLLPSLHALGQPSARASSEAGATFDGDQTHLRESGAVPAHHADSCPQCQSFAHARGHAVPAQGACLRHTGERCDPLDAHDLLQPATAPGSGGGSPRAPPSVLSSI